MIKDNSFSKSERVCSRSSVAILFDGGESLFSFPFKSIYRIHDIPEVKSLGISVRVMVSVSKRYHKRAVRRNRVKRLIREAYRTNKSEIYPLIAPLLDGKVLDICYIYTSKKEEDFKTIENGVRKSFEKLAALLTKNNSSGTDHVDKVLPTGDIAIPAEGVSL